MRTLLLFGLVFGLRVFNALSIRTFFQPDEYWQSLEPAHILVYGYGYTTWEWHEHLRSAIYPLLYAGVYRAADFFDVNVIIAPKLFQAGIATLTDYYTWKLGTSMFNRQVGNWALVASLGSAFTWFCGPRTFSNCLETAMTAAALSYWPWKVHQHPGSLIPYGPYVAAVLVASVACVFRPTNALIWGYLAAALLWDSPPRQAFDLLMMGQAAVFTSLFVNFFIDNVYYGEPVFPLGKFIMFNVVQSLSQFYGVSPWHYYLSQGLPLLLIGYLPVAIYQGWKLRSSILVQVVLFVIAAYSLLSHKEVRFILPLLPLLHVLVAKGLAGIRPAYIALLILINIPFAAYFSLVHQRGVIDVIDFLREDSSMSSIGFLMPCHSTPWQSHLHRPDVEAWFLTCEPPIGLSEDSRAAYLDEADQFYADPIAFLDEHFPADRQWPSHLAFFEALGPEVRAYLENQNYSLYNQFFNSHFHDDWRRQGDVIVYRRSEPLEEAVDPVAQDATDPQV